MAKTKKFSDFMAICFVFWANISTGLWDPLGCSDLSQIFFGSSPTGIEWDKIVAEIIITTFVFLRHPTHPLSATLDPNPSGVGDQNLIKCPKLIQAEHFKLKSCSS